MTNGGDSNPNWKFDPKTGQPVNPNPSEQGQFDAFRAPSGAQNPSQQQPPSNWQEQGPYQQYQQQQQPPTQPYNDPPQPIPPYQQISNPPPAKKGSRVPLFAIIIGVVLLLGIGGGGFYLWQSVLNRPAVSVERLLPSNTLGYFTFDPVLEGQQKASMDKLREAFEAQPGFKDAWDKMTEQAASSVSSTSCDEPSKGTPTADNLDALATYLGNSVTVAVLAPSSGDLQRLQDMGNSGSGQDVIGDVMGKNIVGIVDLDFNPLNKKGPISDLKEQADNVGKAELVETYRNAEIRKFTTKPCDPQQKPQEIYFSLLDGSSTAVIAAKADPLKVLIDGFRDNRTLKDDATFKALSGQVPQERIAGLYINLTEIYKQIQFIAPEMAQSQQLQNVSGSMLLTLSAADDGMQVDVASETDLSLMDTSIQINPDSRPDPSTLNDIPIDAMAFYAGTDLKTTLEAALKNLRSNTEMGGEVDRQIKSFEDTVGVKLEQDVIPLLGGDYVISVSMNGTGQDAVPSAIFQLKLSEPAKVVDLLDKTLGKNPESNAQSTQVAGGTFYGDEFSGVMLGVTQDRFWFTFSADRQAAEAAIEAAVSNLGKGFGTTARWNTAKAHLARDSNAVAFLDIDALRAYLEGQFVGTMIEQSDYEANVAPFVRPLKYFLIGSATQSVKNGQLSRNHTVLFLGIGK